MRHWVPPLSHLYPLITLKVSVPELNGDVYGQIGHISHTPRVVHRSGGSGFCPTRNSSGGWFFNPQPTHNSNGFVGSGRRWVVVGFGWNRSHWNPSKRGEILPDPSKIRWDPVGSGEIFSKSWWKITGLAARSGVYCAKNRQI